MFLNDFKWSDLGLISHYWFSVFTCVLALIVTYFVSKKYDGGIKVTMSTQEKSQLSKESENDVTSSFATSTAKESPAILAEKVIKANMTEEQRKLEYEVRQQQLAQIHELMMKQSDKFGNISLSEVEEQMKLYQ